MFDLFSHITGQVRKTLQDYNMIRPGDKLVVGLSGGKDSLTLLTVLAELRSYYPIPYKLAAVTVDLGFDSAVRVGDVSSDSGSGDCSSGDSVFAALTEYCVKLGVDHTIIKTNIGKVVFDYKTGENPCSICANMRRGALNNAAVSLGGNKVVLAHNRDDLVETMLLSLFYEGRISSFTPMTYLGRKQLYVLRPLILTEEKDIISYTHSAGLPIVENPCPANGDTKRQFIKVLLNDLSKENKHIKSNIFGAIKRGIFRPD